MNINEITKQELLALFEATPQAVTEHAAEHVVKQLRDELFEAGELLDDARDKSKATDEWKAYTRRCNVEWSLEQAEAVRKAAYLKADFDFQEVEQRLSE